MTSGLDSPEFTHFASELGRDVENKMRAYVQGLMPATKREQKMCHAVALETEHRQKQCGIGRGEDVLELARSEPTSVVHWSQPAGSGAWGGRCHHMSKPQNLFF